MLFGCIDGGYYSIESILASNNYTGARIYCGWEAIGTDTPPSCIESIWGDGTCSYCDAELDEDHELDHIVPKSEGGSLGVINLAPACRACNARKSNQLGWETKDGRFGAYRDMPEAGFTWPERSPKHDLIELRQRLGYFPPYAAYKPAPPSEGGA